MPFLLDTLSLGFRIVWQLALWLAQLGFVTREFLILREDAREPHWARGRFPAWRIRFLGWSRFTRSHRVTERSTTYLWL